MHSPSPAALSLSDGTALLPLVVDLDGTLICTDMLHESALQLFRDEPLTVLHIPFWLSRGKAALKQELAQRTQIDVATLPYQQDLLRWLHEQRDMGRKLILCTASDKSFAQAIANHHSDLFSEVMASDGEVNLEGKNKARALVQRFGSKGFDYAGNSQADLAVWEEARHAIVVNAPSALVTRAKTCCEVAHVFAAPRPGLATWSRMLRIHQWMKNGLLFVPLLAAHQLTDSTAWLHLLLAFVAFSLCASSVYIANDLMDLESDRQHPRKRYRPFASGAIPVRTGVLMVPLLALASLAISSLVGPAFMAWLGIYFVITWAYSWRLKRVVLVDCLALAVLYTLRVVAGAAAAGLPLSFWLLAFSGFLFLSLAFVKRYAELQVQLAAGKDKAHGRGYFTSDAPLIQTLGVCAGYTAVVVMALYLNSDAVVRMYRTPEVVWAAVPIMVYWISWMWLRAFRGEMHDDPLVFAVKDKASLTAGVLFAAVVLVGSMGLQW